MYNFSFAVSCSGNLCQGAIGIKSVGKLLDDSDVRSNSTQIEEYGDVFILNKQNILIQNLKNNFSKNGNETAFFEIGFIPNSNFSDNITNDTDLVDQINNWPMRCNKKLPNVTEQIDYIIK